MIISLGPATLCRTGDKGDGRGKSLCCCCCCSIIILEFQSGESFPTDSLPQDSVAASPSSLFFALLHMIRPIAAATKVFWVFCADERDARCWGVAVCGHECEPLGGRGKGTVRMPFRTWINNHSTDITPIWPACRRGQGIAVLVALSQIADAEPWELEWEEDGDWMGWDGNGDRGNGKRKRGE
jgi:hypothetical protein